MSTVTNLTPWGYHAILDCSNCDLASIKNESTIRSWLSELSTVLNTSAVGEPVVVITGKGDPRVEGFGVAQLLENGTVTANFVNSDKHIYIDVFSSREFTVSSIETIIKTHFGADININKIFLPRNAGALAPN